MPSSSATAPTSDYFDNPWESAANDDAYRSSTLRAADERAAAAAASSSSSSSPAAAAASGDPRRPESLKNRCVRCNQVLDGLTGALFAVFFFFSYHKNRRGDAGTTHPGALEIALMALSVLLGATLLLRSVIGGRSFRWNVNTRPVLILLYLVMAIVLFADAQRLPAWIMKLQLQRKEVLPLSLLFLAIMEASLLFLLCHWHDSELEDARDAENLSRYTGATRPTNRSPWWWSRNNGDGNRPASDTLERPLLFGQPSWTNTSNDYQVEDGVNEPSSSWWPFSRGGGGGDRRQNPRDDGSVDYASLNEDWASRSEADPIWWSRDDDAA